jgi:hypothetical protein
MNQLRISEDDMPLSLNNVNKLGEILTRERGTVIGGALISPRVIVDSPSKK